MKIGFVSDTHGCVESWRRAVTGPLAGADLIIHTGDVLYHGPRNPIPATYNPPALAEMINSAPCPVILCRGNCDAVVDQLLLRWPVQEPYALVYLNGLTIIATHGYKGEKQEPLAEDDLLELARLYRSRLVVCGHSHAWRLKEKEGVILLNPGSTSLPKEGPGTVARLVGNKLQVVTLDGEQVLAEKEIAL